MFWFIDLVISKFWYEFKYLICIKVIIFQYLIYMNNNLNCLNKGKYGIKII